MIPITGGYNLPIQISSSYEMLYYWVYLLHKNIGNETYETVEKMPSETIHKRDVKKKL